MTLPAAVVQTGTTFIAATIGSLLGAFLTLRVNRSKHFQELRSAAYVDYLRALSKVAIVRKDPLPTERNSTEELDGVILLTDAKVRIGIYGSEKVVRALAQFIGDGNQTFTKEGMAKLTRVCELMRKESVSEDVPFDDLNRILFS